MSGVDVAEIAKGLRAAGKSDWLTIAWDRFCDCDALPDGIDYQAYLDWLDQSSLVECRPVEDDDLDDAFADERGIVPGGSIYVLTPLGLALRAHLLASREGE